MPEVSLAAEEPEIQECCGVCMLRYQYMATFNCLFLWLWDPVLLTHAV